jgi:hypothetical protein
LAGVFDLRALFPAILIAEGTANFGKDVVFTPAERMESERKALFPPQPPGSKNTPCSSRRAHLRLRFVERYRGYVINYNFGEDMARHYIEGQGGTVDQPEKRSPHPACPPTCNNSYSATPRILSPILQGSWKMSPERNAPEFDSPHDRPSFCLS